MKPLEFDEWQLFVNNDSEHDVDCYCVYWINFLGIEPNE